MTSAVIGSIVNTLERNYSVEALEDAYKSLEAIGEHMSVWEKKLLAEVCFLLAQDENTDAKTAEAMARESLQYTRSLTCKPPRNACRRLHYG